MTDQLHDPGAWRVAQVCEENMQRFERITRDLVTAPGVSAEEVARIRAQVLAVADAIEAPVRDEEPTP